MVHKLTIAAAAAAFLASSLALPTAQAASTDGTGTGRCSGPYGRVVMQMHLDASYRGNTYVAINPATHVNAYYYKCTSNTIIAHPVKLDVSFHATGMGFSCSAGLPANVSCAPTTTSITLGLPQAVGTGKTSIAVSPDAEVGYNESYAGFTTRLCMTASTTIDNSQRVASTICVVP